MLAFHRFRPTIKGMHILVALIPALGLCGPTQAKDWKAVGEFGWFGIGKSYEMGKGHFYWVGEVSGIFFSDKGGDGLFHLAGVRCPLSLNTDLNNKKITGTGTCIIRDASGDEAYTRFHSEGEPGKPGAGIFEYTGGTGKYEGITGENKYAPLATVLWPDGTVSGHSSWNR